MALETPDDFITTETKRRRISWGAVFAGVTIALVVQLVLTMLGVGIGASTINPMQQADPMRGLGIGAIIWLAITALLGLFAGGWVSGRLAGEPRGTEGTLHGLLTWGLASLFAFYLVTTAIGSFIGGAVGVAGRIASAAGSAASKAAPAVMEAARAQLGDIANIDTSNIRQEAENLLRQTGKPELQPENLKQQAQQAAGEAQQRAGQAAQYPQAADSEFKAAFDRLFGQGSQIANAADKEALVNVIVARTNMPREEASRTVDRWQQMYRNAQEQYAQLKTEAIQTGKQVADTAASGVAKGALWTSLILVLSAVAAAFGGYLGAPERRDTYGPAI